MGKLFAIGDIHGCCNTLNELFSKIAPSKADKIVFLGDYIDRGPRIRQTVNYLLDLKQKGFQTEYLLGNHEWFLLNTLTNPSQSTLWHLNGGMPTLESFGIDEANRLDPVYLSFFQDLLPYIQIKDKLFVHAGFNDEINNPFSDLETMLWTRNEEYNSKQLSNKTIVHGHTPISPNELQKRVEKQHKVLNIDTGCVYNLRPGYGYLTALELNSMSVTTIKNCD